MNCLAALHCRLTVQVWIITLNTEGFFDCLADRVPESGLAEAYNASQRKPVAVVLLIDLKYGFVYKSACIHVGTRGSSVPL